MALQLTLRSAEAVPVVARVVRLGDIKLSPGNRRRAQRALSVVRRYAKSMNQQDEALSVNVQDLFTDILHLARWKELDWTAIERLARMHFGDEVHEEQSFTRRV